MPVAASWSGDQVVQGFDNVIKQLVGPGLLHTGRLQLPLDPVVQRPHRRLGVEQLGQPPLALTRGFVVGIDAGATECVLEVAGAGQPSDLLGVGGLDPRHGEGWRGLRGVVPRRVVALRCVVRQASGDGNEVANELDRWPRRRRRTARRRRAPGIVVIPSLRCQPESYSSNNLQPATVVERLVQ